MEEKTNTGICTSFSKPSLGICSGIAAASTADESTSPCHAQNQKCHADDSGATDIGFHDLVAHNGMLKAEELRIVDSALKKLCTPLLPDCKITARAEMPQQEVWKLLWDEDWRKAGIRGK